MTSKATPATTKQRRDLTDVLKEDFAGPFHLKFEQERGASTPRLRPLTHETERRMIESLGLDRGLPFMFPVTAWHPQKDDVVEAMVRLSRSGNIVETVPQTPWALERTGRWQPKPFLNPKALALEKVEGHDGWSFKDKKGPVLRLRTDVTVSPSEDGKAHFEPNTMCIRPLFTRCFFLLEPPSARSLEVRVRDIDVYSEMPEDQFSYAIQAPFLGFWAAAGEIVGINALRDVARDIDSFEYNLNELIRDRFGSWVNNILIPPLHPDSISKLGLPVKALAMAIARADEGRNSALRLLEWMNGWGIYAIAEYRAKRKSGIQDAAIRIPEPVGREYKEGLVLVDMTPDQIISRIKRIAGVERNPERTKTDKGKSVTKAAPKEKGKAKSAAPATPPAKKTIPKKAPAKKHELRTLGTVGDANPDLERLARNIGHMVACVCGKRHRVAKSITELTECSKKAPKK